MPASPGSCPLCPPRLTGRRGGVAGRRSPALVLAAALGAGGGLLGAPGPASASSSPGSTNIFVISQTVKGTVPTMTGVLTRLDMATGKALFQAKVPALPTAVAVLASGAAYVAGVGSDELGSPASLTAVSASGHAGATIKLGANAMDATALPNGKAVYVLEGLNAATQPPTAPGTLTWVNTSSNKVIGATKVAANPTGMGMSPNGATVVVLGQKAVSLTSTATSKTFSISDVATGVGFSPNSNYAYLLVPGKLQVVAVNLSTHTVSHAWGTGLSIPEAIAVSPNGSQLYVAGEPDSGLGAPPHDTLEVLSSATGTVVTTVNLGNYPWAYGWTVRVSPDAKTVAALAWGTAKVQGRLMAVDVGSWHAHPGALAGVAAQDLAIGPDDLAYVLDAGTTNAKPGGVLTVDLSSGRVGKLLKVAPLAQRMALEG